VKNLASFRSREKLKKSRKLKFLGESTVRCPFTALRLLPGTAKLAELVKVFWNVRKFSSISKQKSKPRKNPKTNISQLVFKFVFPNITVTGERWSFIISGRSNIG
jgi:hypothetical protein